MASRYRPAKRHLFQHLGNTLLDGAPEEATGYRLAIRKEGEPTVTYFPAEGVFDLEPFEPPQVPIVGQYVVVFYDPKGFCLGTPRELLSGVYVEHAELKD
jgi:hypothetical protein